MHGQAPCRRSDPPRCSHPPLVPHRCDSLMKQIKPGRCNQWPRSEATQPTWWEKPSCSAADKIRRFSPLHRPRWVRRSAAQVGPAGGAQDVSVPRLGTTPRGGTNQGLLQSGQIFTTPLFRQCVAGSGRQPAGPGRGNSLEPPAEAGRCSKGAADIGRGAVTSRAGGRGKRRAGPADGTR